MAFRTSGTGEKEVTPFDYVIQELFIISDGGELDVTYLLSEMNINENLFAKCITGSLVLTDSLNLIANMPIMEGDLIKGTFERNKDDVWVDKFDPDFVIDFTYEIVKIIAQTKIKQDVQVIALSFVSSTYTDHLSGRISKSYKQMAYSDMVLEIYDEWLSRGGLKGELPTKFLNVETSDEVWNMIIPNMKPYDAITMLSRKSFKGDAANYLFWEDKEEFHYEPIENLLKADSVADYYTASADQWTSESSGKIPDIKILEPRYLNLIDMKYLGYHDISVAAQSGMLGNRLIKHDIYNKRVTDYFPRGEEAPNYIIDTPYDYFGDYAKTKHVDDTKELVKAYTNTKMAEDDGNTILSVYPDHENQWDDQVSFKPEDWLRQRKGQMAQLKFIKFEVKTPGNLTRKVGDKIFLKIWSPEWTPRAGGQIPEYDSKLQGNYLITAIRRKFTQDHYTNIMEVIKDDYFDLKTKIFETIDAPPNVKLDGQGNVRGL